MKRTPLTSSVEQQREWEQRTREKAMARRRESSREGRAPFARRRAALPKRGRNFTRNRREQFGDDGKREWIISLGCLVCPRTPSEPHHEPPRSLGGKAADMVPLCTLHHAERHFVGLGPFQEIGYPQVDLVAEASRLEEEWAA